MPSRPAPRATAKEPIAPIDPLYKAMEARMEAEDTKSRPARVQALLGRLETLLGTDVKAEAGSVTPASTELLGMDPGEAAVGKLGFFWDEDFDTIDGTAIGVCGAHNPTARDKYGLRDGADFQHFLEARVEVHPQFAAMLSKACK